jgi:acyl-CoA synthetase (NDP forming)
VAAAESAAAATASAPTASARAEAAATASPPADAAALVREAVVAELPALDEWRSKRLLAEYGVPVPIGALASSEADAVAAAARIGGRVAMKAVGANIHHKTEGGLVQLRIPADDAEAVTAAYRLIAGRAGVALEGVLVEEMLDGNRELLVGLKRDPVFGPVVAFGLGGILTEVLGDVALAVVPLSERDIAELPDLVRARKLLGPFRGAPPVDRELLGRVIAALGRLAIDFPEIAEIDINPLIVAGDRPVAADALVILCPEATQPAPGRAFEPDLRAVFAPDSVAIIGASEDIRKWGGSALRNILDGGYAGKVYPVNPRGGVFFGVHAYPSLAELPEGPDLVLLAVGGAQVKGVLEEAGKCGARAAVVLTAGFSETGPEGAAREREILRVASEHGMTLIGPNCMGLLSNEKRLHGTGLVALHPSVGTLTFVSQSGSMGPTVINMCQRRGIGLDKFISVGNEAMVSAFDVLDHLREDPATQCVMLYLEGVDDGRHFLEVAKRTTLSKPVVVLRGGLTEEGGQAAASHTGALAGSAAVYHAAARQSGVVTCGTTEQLVDLGACLAHLPLPRGRRVAVITNGGGPGVLAADEVALNNLELAPLAPEVIAALDEILPPFWSKRNPLDLVAAGLAENGFRALELVARCATVDAVLFLNFLGVPSTSEARERLASGEFEGFTELEQTMLLKTAELMSETGKPIIHVPDSPVHGQVPAAGRYTPMVLSSPRSAAQALSSMAWYGEYRRGAGAGRGAHHSYEAAVVT